MKKIFIALILIIIIAGGIFVLTKKNFGKTIPRSKTTSFSNYPCREYPKSNPSSTNEPISSVQISNGFQPPLDRASERVTKKPFGIYITPKTSPVQPERFQGYHTGTDFEIFPEELNADVPVHAICTGKIAVKRSASGYGGVLVQNCELNNQPITVIYGHLKLASIAKNAGDNFERRRHNRNFGKSLLIRNRRRAKASSSRHPQRKRRSIFWAMSSRNPNFPDGSIRARLFANKFFF